MKTISRTPHHTAQLRSPRDAGRKTALFVGLIVFVFSFGVGLFAHCVAEWRTFHVQVPISRDSWRVLEYGSADSEACASLSKLGPRCPASPANSRLWTSSEVKAGGDWTKTSKKTAKRPRRFWIGARFGSEVLAKVREAGAGKFVIGSINGSYRIWIDGELVTSGEGWAETEPVVIDVPLSRLQSSAPLHIALDIDNTSGAAYPDLFNERNGGEGFVTTKAENAYRSKMTMLYRVRPFSLSVAYAVLSLLFFLIWRASLLRQEYYWIAVFAAVSAMFMALTVDMLQFQLPPALDYSLMNACLFAHAFAGLFLGMSFARLRPEYFRVGVWLMVAVCSALLFSGALGLLSTSAQIWWWRLGMEWIRPAFFASASVLCLGQARTLFRGREGSAALPARRWRLGWLGVAMGAFALVYFVESRGLIPEAYVFYRLFRGFEFLAGIVWLASIAMKEFGESEAFVQRSPVSIYHRRSELPESLSGALLSVDLKSSEVLTRIGERDGNSGAYVALVLSHLWNAVARAGGFVLQTDGDGLRAFFDGNACADPLNAAMAAIDEIHAELDVVAEQLRFQHGLPEACCRLRFRAAVANGDIRPVWQEHGSERQSSWVAVGNRHCFVVAARLLELERTIAGAAQASYALLSEADAGALGKSQVKARGAWVLRNKAIVGKHNRVYHVAVYGPGSSGRGEELEAA